MYNLEWNHWLLGMSILEQYSTGLSIYDEYLLVFQAKMWLKPSAEQQFLYGHNVTKAGLGRISENVQKYSGVVVYSMNDLPLVSHTFPHLCCLYQ